MNNHQKKQIEVINQIESQINNNKLKFSVVAPVEDYNNDPRLCLTSIHIPSNFLKQKVLDEIIKPLKKLLPNAYFYSPDSMHMTIKNIKVINNPPNFTRDDVQTAKKIFTEIIPKHKKFQVYFYRLLLFPNNLALIGTTDSELDNIILDLDTIFKKNNLEDDKTYLNSQYFFSNMTLARFSNPSVDFVKKVQELSKQIKFEPYIVDSVSLITCNAVLKNLQIIGTWKLI